MMTPIQISAKHLGQLVSDSFCERRFWVRLHCQDKFPFAIFPGIFSSIDSYIKKVTAAHFAKHGRVPFWFDGFGALGTPMKVSHWSKFNVADRDTNVTLTGVPDEMLIRQDGSLFIGDYKCARHTATADELHPLYIIQLNCYAYIAERLRMGAISGLGLPYYEPPSALAVEDTDTLITTDGFFMRFTAKVLPIKLGTRSFPFLLGKVGEIYDWPVPPAGRIGCKDCALLQGFVSVAPNMIGTYLSDWGGNRGGGPNNMPRLDNIPDGAAEIVEVRSIPWFAQTAVH
jgi:hypothetical protein